MLQSQKTISQVLPKQGVWDMRGKCFVTGVNISNWAIACFSPQLSVTEEVLR